MTDVTIWSILFLFIWPYIVILLVYLAAWIDEKLSIRKVTKEDESE